MQIVQSMQQLGRIFCIFATWCITHNLAYHQMLRKQAKPNHITAAAGGFFPSATF